MQKQEQVIYLIALALIFGFASIICIVAIQTYIENQLFDFTAGFLAFLLPISLMAWRIKKGFLSILGKVSTIAYVWGAAGYLSVSYDCGFYSGTKTCTAPPEVRFFARIALALFVLCHLLLLIRRRLLLAD